MKEVPAKVRTNKQLSELLGFPARLGWTPPVMHQTSDGRGKGVRIDLKAMYVYADGLVVIDFADEQTDASGKPFRSQLVNGDLGAIDWFMHGVLEPARRRAAAIAAKSAKDATKPGK